MALRLSNPVLLAGIAASALVGVVIGIGGYTFVYARGASYLTDDPGACANCHVMGAQYAGWRKSSHHAVAVCNDCHAPADLIPKYFTKALNGYHHSSAFTTGDFPATIRITPRNRAITEQRCRDCHAALTAQLTGPHAGPGATACIRCHDSVGHLSGD